MHRQAGLRTDRQGGRLPAIGAVARALAAIVVSAVLAACGDAPPAIEGAAADVRDLTGAHTRLVWVQGDGTDPLATGDDLILMGFDTDDGRGERTLLDEQRSYVKPMLTPSGERVVFSSRPTLPGGPEVFVVDWDGSNLRTLGRGFALAVWQDPGDGREWVYVGSDPREYDFATVTRYPIDDMSVAEPVWNQSLVSADTFQVSADGRQAAGLFPWPHAGIADLTDGTWQRLGQGCWTALAPADLPLVWYFDGAHRNVLLVDLAGGQRWTVNVGRAPGFDGAEVYHPRWTNHPRFLAISGPYNQGGPNQVRTGGAQVGVWMGRFSADYTRVEAWARVTDNSAGDSYPDVWIERDQSPHAFLPRGPIGPATADARSEETAGGRDARRAVVQARLAEPGPVPTPESILPYRNALVVNAYDVVTVIEGSYGERRLLVAQWAIRDGRVLPDAHREIGAEHALIVERYDAHPELEGERLIQQSDDPTLPLYYDVGS